MAVEPVLVHTQSNAVAVGAANTPNTSTTTCAGPPNNSNSSVPPNCLVGMSPAFAAWTFGPPSYQFTSEVVLVSPAGRAPMNPGASGGATRAQPASL